MKVVITGGPGFIGRMLAMPILGYRNNMVEGFGPIIEAYSEDFVDAPA